MGNPSADASMITLDRYLRSARLRIDPGLSATLGQVALAVKRISNELAVAALKGELGLSGATNVQGEKVEKLDTWSNNVFLDSFAGGHPICTLISEEIEEPRHSRTQHPRDTYALLYDPLDGSSNTEVNGSLGTIFALRRRKPGHGDDIADALGPGTEQIIAGYALYGPATILVWTAGDGVNAFVLEREGGGYSLRYCGAFVGDFHRCLLTGGIFFYPGEVSAGSQSKGKLRLMYEVA